MSTTRSRISRDRQLAGVDAREAKRRWEKNLPVTLKQMAAALELGYTVVRGWARMPGFPMLKGLLFPRMFERWLESSFSQNSGTAPALPAHRPLQAVDKTSESSCSHGSRGALPKLAARIYELAGLRR